MDVNLPTRAIPCQGLWLLSEGHFLAQSHQCQGLWLLSEGHFLAQSHQRQGLWQLSQRLMLAVSFLVVVVVVVSFSGLCILARPRSGG